MLVHENDGRWSLPGGWVDVLESIESNTIKEVREEAGLEVRAERVIAIQDRNKRNRPVYAYGICKVFMLCGVCGRKLEGAVRLKGGIGCSAAKGAGSCGWSVG